MNNERIPSPLLYRFRTHTDRFFVGDARNYKCYDGVRGDETHHSVSVKIADAWTWSGVVSLPSSGERVTTEPFNPGFMTTYLQLM